MSNQKPNEYLGEKERYAIIDGRMVRRGWAPEPIRTERLSEFCHAFPMFKEEAPRFFSLFFNQESHTHAALAAFAFNPRAAVGNSPTTPQPGSRCSLCGFPTHAFELDPERLAGEVIAEITQDFPRWDPSQGLCAQCADLYRTRTNFSSAATGLPG